VIHRFLRLEQEIARTNTLLGQRRPPSHGADISTSGNDLGTDPTGIWTLQKTLQVAEEVRSTWDPDADSLRRVQRSISSRSGYGSDDSGSGNDSDVDETPHDSRSSSPGADEDEELGLVPDLDSTTPLPLLSMLIDKFQTDARREFNTGNMNRAEANQIEAIAHLDEREERYKIPFDNRPEMRQFLAQIHIRQHNLTKARSIMLELARQEQAAGSDGLSRAKQHHILSEIYYEMFLADGNLAHLEPAEKCSRSAFNQLYQRAREDPLLLASNKLLVQILEARNRIAQADAFRSMVAPQSPITDILEVEPHPQEPVPLEPPADVNPPETQGITTLFSAVRSLNPTALQEVLQRDPDIHQKCSKDWTPLMHAVEVGFELAVRKLVDRGADVNATANPNKLTALHQAASRGNVDMIDLLIELDAGIECRTRDGATPLLTAVKENQILAVNTLLHHQADTSVKDSDGLGVLHYAVRSPTVDIMELLLSQERAPDVNCRCPDGSTPLHFAAKTANRAAAGLLIRYGADIEAQDFSGERRTPLYLAVSNPRTAPREVFVNLLLDNQAIVDRTRLPPKSQDYNLREPLPPPLDRTDSGFFSLGRRDSGRSTRTSASVASVLSRRFTMVMRRGGAG
jgi:ankyrin repeat protein